MDYEAGRAHAPVAGPRFRVSGHMEGTSEAIRIVVSLSKGGSRVQEWDVTLPRHAIRRGELDLAYRVVRALTEYTS